MITDIQTAFTTASPGAYVSENNGMLKLAVDRKTYGYTEFTFTSDISFLTGPYMVLKYSAKGLQYNANPHAPFLFAKSGGEVKELVRYQDIAVDTRIHTVIAACRFPKAESLTLTYNVKTLRADFTIHELYFCDEIDLPCVLTECETPTTAALTPIDLEPYFNHHYEPENPDILIEGGVFFTKENVNIHSVPFHIKTEGTNVIYPSPSPKENEDIISNFGVQTRRRLCRPISRDSVIEIDIHKPASEIYFILAANGLMYQRFSFGIPDPTILGGCRSELMMPLRITDAEFFLVEICYEDGRVDTAFPLSISKNRHVVGSETDAYVVPADGSMVRSVRIHNKKLETDLSVVALTINETEERLYPQTVIPAPKQITDNSITAASDNDAVQADNTAPEISAGISASVREITLKDNILSIKNGALSMEIDTANGLYLKHIANAYTKEFSFAPGALLRIRDAENSEHCEFEHLHTELIRTPETDCDSAKMIYRYGTLILEAIISLTEDHNVSFKLSCRNIGEQTEQISILYPYFTGGRFASDEDSWYFFPKCQNLNSNEHAHLYGESAPTFPMQFFDLYSKSQNGGLALNTYEREVVVRIYSIDKSEDGMTAFVQYPFMYGDIAAGETFTCSEATITAHDGDWRKAFAIYKKWVDSWYTPHERAQNKEWYRRDFWLLAEIADFFETREFIDMPPWYDDEKKRMKFRDILEEHKSVTGCYPDILHMWGWTYDKKLRSMKWGNWSDEDYEIYGGKEAFREALHDVQDNMGIDVSLYLHPTLLSKSYAKSEKFFPKCRVERENGTFIGSSVSRMCHANEEWRKEAISFYPKIYEDLKIPILYVDEFSLRIENRCFGKNHGHHVPSNLLKTDRDFISELRDVVPGEVVLYGEYTAVDVNARYIDCNITYQYIDAVMNMIEVNDWRYDDGDDTYSRVLTNVYRYAFPKIVQLNLPMAMRKLSWHPQKFIFFNGEAIYDSFWDNEESAGLEFTVKAYKLKKKYAHCFASDYPETMIETPSEAICANKFPAENETLYTLYNRAYSTYRGPLLAVPHMDGQTYYDAWNDKILEPEIRDDFAILSGQMDAQQIGCIVVKK